MRFDPRLNKLLNENGLVPPSAIVWIHKKTATMVLLVFQKKTLKNITHMRATYVASYVALASVGENPRPQLDATSPENALPASNKKSMNVMTY